MSQDAHAPELDAGLGWLNTDRPLGLSDELRGQVVVLDFWTYCCINCMHILPDLAYLEGKYEREPVTFIGVHSAKFANEALRPTIRAAILRYEIRHPVVIDDDMKIWRSYGVRSWPTLVVIDPTGHVVCVAAGEGNRAAIDRAIAQTLEAGRANGTLADEPLTLKREASVRATSGLAFPGKVLADAPLPPQTGGKPVPHGEGDIVDLTRLYVADSNHNRIVIAELRSPQTGGKAVPHGAAATARVIKVVGSGAIGSDDGPAEQATFNHPQGLAVGQGKLYVADTENHLIRAIDLDTFAVTTIVGTGEMTNDRTGGSMGTQQGLNSPWDLVLEGSTLYVAMAGVHQIWRIDLPVGLARALAGSGRENIVDGPAETAALAQPSGICVVGGNIYFADSEVSAIRGIDMSAERVFTVIGEGLFSFGDVDGTHPQAKLQHPLGVDVWKTSLVVADTYNHKIKLVDPQARCVRTLYGTGAPAVSSPDGGPAFFEPGGLSVAGDDLYVADTNNHRVVRINLLTGDFCEIAFEGLEAPACDGPDAGDAITGRAKTLVAAPPVSIAADRDIELILDIKPPEGTHLSPEAPWSIRVTAGGETIVQQTGRSEALPLRVQIPAASTVTGTTWEVTAAFACCTSDDRGLCVPAQLTWSVPVESGGDGVKVTLRAAPDGPHREQVE